MQSSPDAPAQSVLEQAGLAAEAAADWLGNELDLSGDYRRDAAAGSHFWLTGAKLLARLPPKPRRGAAQAAAAGLITQASRRARDRFLELHAEALYRTLTKDYRSFVRVEQLAFDAAAVPGLTPTREQVAMESGLPQKDKEGVEIDQGIFLAHVLARETAGGRRNHRLHALHHR